MQHRVTLQILNRSMVRKCISILEKKTKLIVLKFHIFINFYRPLNLGSVKSTLFVSVRSGCIKLLFTIGTLETIFRWRLRFCQRTDIFLACSESKMTWITTRT